MRRNKAAAEADEEEEDEEEAENGGCCFDEELLAVAEAKEGNEDVGCGGGRGRGGGGGGGKWVNVFELAIDVVDDEEVDGKRRGERKDSVGELIGDDDVAPAS